MLCFSQVFLSAVIFYWLNLSLPRSLDALGVPSYSFNTVSTANILVSMQTRSPAILPSFSALLEGRHFLQHLYSANQFSLVVMF